jgi:uncharacterized membrane protein YoaT (DUF817 family)
LTLTNFATIPTLQRHDVVLVVVVVVVVLVVTEGRYQNLHTTMPQLALLCIVEEDRSTKRVSQY